MGTFWPLGVKLLGQKRFDKGTTEQAKYLGRFDRMTFFF